MTRFDKIEIDKIKEKFNREKKAIRILREIFCYSIFLVILFFISYTNKDLNSFHYQNNLKNSFGISSRIGVNNNRLNNIIKINDIWSWTRTNFLPSIQSNNWYNSVPTNLKHYLADHTSYLIGYPIIRQLRIKNGIYILFYFTLF